MDITLPHYSTLKTSNSKFGSTEYWEIVIVFVAGFCFFLIFSQTHNVIYNDFFGFISRAESLRIGHLTSQELVHPYYPLGYPLLLSMLGRLVDDYVLWGKLLSAFAGGLLLTTVYLLSFHLFNNRIVGLLAVAFSASNYEIFYWGNSLGVDMLLSAFVLASIYFFLQATSKNDINLKFLALAGAILGIAYLIKYTAITILPILLLVIIGKTWKRGFRIFLLSTCVFVFFFAIASLPQTYLSLIEKGTPFWNRQVDNLWRGEHNTSGWITEQTPPENLTLYTVIASNPVDFAKRQIRASLSFFQNWNLSSPLSFFMYAGLLIAVFGVSRRRRFSSFVLMLTAGFYVFTILMAFYRLRFFLWLYAVGIIYAVGFLWCCIVNSPVHLRLKLRYIIVFSICFVFLVLQIDNLRNLQLWQPRNLEYNNISNALHLAGMRSADEVVFLWPEHDYFYDTSDRLKRPFVRWRGERETLNEKILLDGLISGGFRFLIVEPSVPRQFPLLSSLSDPNSAPDYLSPVYESAIQPGLVVYEIRSK